MSAWWRRWGREGVWLLLFGLAAQLFWAGPLTTPTHMDAYYYTTNGQRLAQGSGWTEEVIWQFLDEPAGLPTPSHSYWMPLASLLAAPGYALCDCFRGAQLPFLLLTSTLPLLAYAISWWLYGERWQARMAAGLTASGGFFAALWNQPETFAPFAWAGGLSLLAAALGTTGTGPRWRWWALAGLMAGLAHLTRADGFLLLIAALLVWLTGRRHGRDLGAMLVLYALVMAPWIGRNWLVWGRLLPSAGAQTMFLTTYDDLFAFGRHFGLAGYLDWGLGNIFRSKATAVLTALVALLGVGGLVFLAPLFLNSLWRAWRTRDRRLGPLIVYLPLLLATMSLLFTFPGSRGGLFHSFSALWPWLMALAPAGLAQAVAWVAARRPSWDVGVATRFFAVAAVGLAFLLTIFLGGDRGGDPVVSDTYPAIAAALPAGAVVMVRNPPGYYYHSGGRAISVPNEAPAGVLAAADAFAVTYLILDQDHPLPLADVYQSATPLWPLVWQRDSVKVYALPAAGNEGP